MASKNNFPIIGIGASAGGLNAFKKFFSGIPPNTTPDMAFVLVQHLASNHQSLLVELIQQSTHLQVFEIKNDIEIQKNCVYVIPPGFHLCLSKGKLHLIEPNKTIDPHFAIDFFFKSLADEEGAKSVGIVLSGSGNDGTLGIRSIDEAGGIAMAQDPLSAEYSSMPQNAISTDAVQYVLSPEDMFSKLTSYIQFHNEKKILNSGPKNDSQSPPDMVSKILQLLQASNGHDFSQYKLNTIYRRIERRIAVNYINKLEDYVQLLKQKPEELDALFHDLLIGVTSFFRDKLAFNELESIAIPALFKNKTLNSTIRIWITGCSTGEEVYSIVILLIEYMQKFKQSHSLQIFATDIDNRAIATARAGIYPASIMKNVSPERLAQFFTLSEDGNIYQIQKSVRDLIIFSVQNLIKDPPFSKIDLISCRNLLIYMNSELQKKLIPLFHYALKPKGILFLGASETVLEFESIFSLMSRQAKIFQRKEREPSSIHKDLEILMQPKPEVHLKLTRPHVNFSFNEKPSLQQITERALIRHITAAAALVNKQGIIFYLHGHSELFLEIQPGENSKNNILKMAREGLTTALHTTLRKAVETNSSIRSPSTLHVKTNDHITFFNLTVCPVAAESLESQYYLVILEEVLALATSEALATTKAVSLNTDDLESQVVSLKEELRIKEDILQSTQEELINTNHDLRTSQEEMQSINEELQSTNEELETSKEELQSINEELTTVNAELQTKVSDLSKINNDINNLISGTGIGTVFVNHSMHILRFTPTVCEIINLIQSDIGRPIYHIVSNLIDYNGIQADLENVLNTLTSIEREVQTKDGKSFLMRIRPYRTLDNVVEGAVISFLDVTEIMRIREASKG